MILSGDCGHALFGAWWRRAILALVGAPGAALERATSRLSFTDFPIF